MHRREIYQHGRRRNWKIRMQSIDLIRLTSFAMHGPTETSGIEVWQSLQVDANAHVRAGLMYESFYPDRLLFARQES